jgi:beta-N-acetylhexosaminidase
LLRPTLRRRPTHHPSRHRRTRLVAAVLGLAVLGTTVAVAALHPNHGPSEPERGRSAPRHTPDRPAPSGGDLAGASGGASAETWARSVLARMSLEEKVGQLFVTYAYGDSADTNDPAAVAHNRALYGVDNAAQLVAKYHLGGVLYFGWAGNLHNPRQVAALSNGIQRAAAASSPHVPALVGIDQEMGEIVRMGPPATQFPGSMALGASRGARGDAGAGDDACTAARITAEELRAVGVNQNYAPDADVNVNPRNPVIGVRSFGSDPSLVASLTARQVRCMQDADVAATVKHFPGHGDTDVDSHTGLPVIHHSRQQWEQVDEPPFTAAVRAGVDSVMTAHIVVPALDPSGDPATLSRPIVTGLLRERLRFDGVVVSDSLAMQGVREKYGDAQVPVLALRAGVDQLLKPPDGGFDLQYHAVVDAVRGGELSEQRVDESVLRVLTLKHRLGLTTSALVDESTVDGRVGTREHAAASRSLTDRTVTLVKNDGNVLPLVPHSGRKVLVTGADAGVTGLLAGAVAERGLPADPLALGENPDRARIGEAVDAARAHDVVLVTTDSAWSAEHEGKRQLVAALLATGRPVVVAAVVDPYDVAYFPQVSTYLATYGSSEPSLDALVRVVFGEVRPTGTLPVAIPAVGGGVLYRYGHGLTY